MISKRLGPALILRGGEATLFRVLLKAVFVKNSLSRAMADSRKT